VIDGLVWCGVAQEEEFGGGSEERARQVRLMDEELVYLL
jgi:hypothetical protein